MYFLYWKILDTRWDAMYDMGLVWDDFLFLVEVEDEVATKSEF